MKCHRCKESIAPLKEWQYIARIDGEKTVAEMAWHEDCYREEGAALSLWMERLIDRQKALKMLDWQKIPPPMDQKGIR